MMSLDLLKEFGYDQKQAVEENPWEQTYGQRTATRIADDDDFGEFERPDGEGSLQTNSPKVTSLGLLDLAEAHATPADATNTWCREGRSMLDPTGIVSELVEHEDDDWGDFLDQPQESLAKASKTPTAGPLMAENREELSPPMPAATPPSLLDPVPETKPEVLNANHTSSLTLATVTTTSQAPPPSNIPPPSILLLLAATLFQSLPTEIKQLLSSAKQSNFDLAPLEQSSITQIKVRLSSARAAARIIAGRKLRWKRDTHLAQSMKIGPSQAGKSGGMKLTGVDRMESRREDQEAAEVVRVWKQHVGSLRTSIASANGQHPGMNLTVPEITENMPVRTAKAGEGALTAPQGCVLCGLKREERVQKVDFDVEDSFGEWWIDHWGHVDCKAFWEENEESLQQRR